ncbi:MAG: hypothetical protein RM368_13595 [Nostoc sp. DedSLP03]|uniref:hypothetical protein n=1 Tax=Nostoc sp. DedSLP03 TaxID=3075400 RepID=UPI002AD52A50|nr:hypothetical protein [Nostoc sp. DedSLP03]MDZ7965990.1 hypothetical protein [Nostoc sp. DedSLP03]
MSSAVEVSQNGLNALLPLTELILYDTSLRSRSVCLRHATQRQWHDFSTRVRDSAAVASIRALRVNKKF